MTAFCGAHLGTELESCPVCERDRFRNLLSASKGGRAVLDLDRENVLLRTIIDELEYMPGPRWWAMDDEYVQMKDWGRYLRDKGVSDGDKTHE